MRLLTYANWKMKIVFDNIIYKDVKRYSLRLPTKERLLMEEQINFYRNHFSLKQAIDFYKTLRTDISRYNFMKAILKRMDNILYLPISLKQYFKNVINQLPKDTHPFFNLLLERALTQSKKNIYLPVVKRIFGEYYKPVLNLVRQHKRSKETPVTKKTVKPEAMVNTARTLIEKLRDDLYFATIYGRSNIRKSVPISVVDEYGYGEWVSRNVSYNTNRFFLYSNHNKLSNIELEHMVYFNVYPGYGHFYDTVVDMNNNIDFDNGATYLINGWAMFAMCHGKNSAYGSNILHEGSYIANCLLKNNLEKGYEDVYVYLLGKYPRAKAIDYLLDYTQYPGHYLSYILGEFGIECLMREGFADSPVDFLETMSTINCGDFFAIYSPRQQKLISEKNIMAKVSSKFAK